MNHKPKKIIFFNKFVFKKCLIVFFKEELKSDFKKSKKAPRQPE